MRLLFGLLTLILLIYFISNPTQAQHDVMTVLNHAAPYVKQSLQHFLSFLKNLNIPKH